MFYKNITNEQVTSLKMLLKLLRYLKICGILELFVTKDRLPYNMGVTYTVTSGSYHPDIHKFPIEVAEEDLEKFIAMTLSGKYPLSP